MPPAATTAMWSNVAGAKSCSKPLPGAHPLPPFLGRGPPPWRQSISWPKYAMAKSRLYPAPPRCRQGLGPMWPKAMGIAKRYYRRHSPPGRRLLAGKLQATTQSEAAMISSRQTPIQNAAGPARTNMQGDFLPPQRQYRYKAATNETTN